MTKKEVTIKVRREAANSNDRFFTELERHRQNRLLKHTNTRSLRSVSFPASPASTALSQKLNHLMHSRYLAMSGKLPVSNCHGSLYSAQIEVGTPGKTFTVAIDTGSSDLWVPSSECDETCNKYDDLYDETKSSTYQIPDTDPVANHFEVSYLDGTKASGKHVKDTLRLGDSIVIEDQIFAQATAVSNYTECGNEVGILGLGFSDISSHNFPTVLSNLKDKLAHPIFSMYLDKSDDYPTSIDMLFGGRITGKEPDTAQSQIVFGGVNQDHYKDCLHWHDLGQFRAKGDVFKGYWDFGLEGVQVGNEAMISSKLAMIDSGATILVGSTETVGRVAKNMGVVCVVLKQTGDAYEIVDCDDPFGWDVAMTECDVQLPSMKFIADGVAYILEHDDLLREITTANGPICVLNMVGAPGFPGWILGDSFLQRYFTVYDFEKKRLGLAPSAKLDSKRCATDTYLDFENQVPIETKKPHPTVSPTSTEATKVPLATTISTGSVPSGGPSGSATVQLGAVGIFSVVVLACFFLLGRRCRPSHPGFKPSDRCDDESHTVHSFESEAGTELTPIA